MSNTIPTQDYAFYCDEAGISNDRYTVVGGLCVARSMVPRMLATLAAFRQKFNMTKELKWTRISDQKLIQYQKLVDYFFALNNVNACQFHCVIFDSHQWKHAKFNAGDADVGISKLYFQVLHHRFARYCAPHGSLFVRLDHRNSSTSLHDLQKMLNAAATRDHGVVSRPFKVVESADSKLCDILQLNDVILGAVCAARNGKHLIETGRASKRVIAKDVLTKSGLDGFDKDTPRNITRFTVWNFRPR
jgi:hypothetical protein